MKSPSKIASLLHEGLAHHQAGRLDSAERVYEKVIKGDPHNANALSLLGVIAHGRNQITKAKTLYARAIASNPNIASIHFNFGNLLSSTGDFDGACGAYGRAIALDPNFGEAHLNFGALLHGGGKVDEALESFRRATVVMPNDPRGHFNLGKCLVEISQRAEAEVSFKRAVALDPVHLDSHLAIVNFHLKDGRPTEALPHARKTVELNPVPEHYSSLGDILRLIGEIDAALEAHRMALAVKPDDPSILYNFAATLHAARRLDESRQIFLRVLTQHPRFVAAHIGLAKVYEHQGLFAEALGSLELALAIEPESPDIIFKMSLLRLAAGSFREGWRDYEQRFFTADRRQIKRPPTPDYWAGEDLNGKTLLIWTEQGLGDEILYAGMIPEVIARAQVCVIECSPRLHPIFARSFPGARVVSSGGQDTPAIPMDGIDSQIALASLGQFLRPTFASFPSRVSYLKADPDRVAILRARYRSLSPGNLVVGISWRSTNQDIGGLKSTDLMAWKDVLRVPGTTFVNLQYGDCAKDLLTVKHALGVDVFQDSEIDPLENLDDFFAQVAAVDVVVSTSNTTVHVAGSLGVETWLLLSGAPGGLWYWFRDRSDSPWYPSMRIMGQSTNELIYNDKIDYRSVLEAAGARLSLRIQAPP